MLEVIYANLNLVLYILVVLAICFLIIEINLKWKSLEKRGKLIKHSISKNRNKLSLILVLIIILIVIASIYFCYSQKCQDRACFFQKLASCSKSSWTNNAQDTIWKYTILGNSEEKCNVNVEILSSTEESTKLANKKMTCIISKSSSTLPGQDLSLCTGKLKEELQDLIINKMQSYIVENLKEINQ